jgi:hypothetical protein
MELAFALQENPCRWFPRKVAVLRFCFTVLRHSTGPATDIAIRRAKYILSWQRIDDGDAEESHRAGVLSHNRTVSQ